MLNTVAETQTALGKLHSGRAYRTSRDETNNRHGRKLSVVLLSWRMPINQLMSTIQT